MTKEELVRRIAKSTGMTKSEASKMICKTLADIQNNHRRNTIEIGPGLKIKSISTFGIRKSVSRKSKKTISKPIEILFNKDKNTIGFGKTYGEQSFNNKPIHTGPLNDFLKK